MHAHSPADNNRNTKDLLCSLRKIRLHHFSGNLIEAITTLVHQFFLTL